MSDAHESEQGRLPFEAEREMGDAAFDATFRTLERVQLDEFSWVDYVPGWLTNDRQLLEALKNVAPWEQRHRRIFNQTFEEPRLTAEYRDIEDAPLALLHEIASALSSRYDVQYDGLWMNHYRDHNDGAGWHADRPADRAETAVVPVLSLGAQRRFLIKPVDGGQSTRFQPRGGDLVVMGGRAQRDWRHQVPKQKTPAGARISLNFTSRKQWAGS